MEFHAQRITEVGGPHLTLCWTGGSICASWILMFGGTSQARLGTLDGKDLILHV